MGGQKMKHIILTATIFVGSSLQVHAAGCDGILTLTRNLDFETRRVQFAEQLHDAYCEGSSLKSGRSFSFGVEAMIKQVPVGLNLGSGSTKEKMQELCSQYDSWAATNQEVVSLALSTSDRAIDAWQRCKELEEQDVFFTVDPRAELVAFGVRRGKDVIDFLGMNYIEDQIICTGPVGEGGREETINTKTRFTLTEAKETPITCRRKYQKTQDGILYLPAAEVSISAEGAAPLLVRLPREEQYEPSLASAIREHLEESDARADQLQSLVDQANQRIAALQQSLGGYVAHGTRVQLQSDEGFLLSNNRQNQDEKDLLISVGTSELTRWTINPAQ